MIAAISLIQNGPVPRYFSEEQLDQIFVQNGPCASECVLEFRRGLDRLGVYKFAQHFNQFINIFRHHQERLTVRGLIQLLQTQFSEEGTNKLQFEKMVYNKFFKYVREAAAGRRIATLEDILIFVRCADEIPILGFAKQPFISFREVSLPEIESKEQALDDKVSIELVTIRILYASHHNVTR